MWVLGYVVMPDHVHLIMVLRGKHDLATVVRLWKGYSSRVIGRESGAEGPVWQDGYYDHMIRNSRDLLNWIDYVHHNPVGKELVGLAEDYQFSTASPRCAGDVDAWWMV
ncbi:MAG: transposase [Armatimonadota bacterium]